MRIDHVIYAAPDLDAAVDDLERRCGVRAAGGGRHDGQGTHNRLLRLGPATYLEVVAPDPGQPEPAEPRPYGVDGVRRPGIVGWALACDDVEAAREQARAAGFDPGEVVDGWRRTVDGTLLRWRVTRNAMTAGVVPFLISWGTTEHPAVSAPAGLTLDQLHVEHPDRPAVESRLRALGADVEVRPGPAPGIVVGLSGPQGVLELR